MNVTREQLYEQVWAAPATEVADRYHVSSSFLARVLDRMNIPRPRRGYWALAAVGRATTRPSLPPLEPGDQKEWIRAPQKAAGGRWSGRRERRIDSAPARRYPDEVDSSVSSGDRVAEKRPVADGKEELERPEDWRAQQRLVSRQAEGRRARNVEESRAELLAAIRAWRVARLSERFLDDVDLHAAGLPDAERVHLFRRVARARALLGPVGAARRILDWRAPEER